MTISSWLNFGRPAPPGRGSAAGRKLLAPPYYSQRVVFASLWALFSFKTETESYCSRKLTGNHVLKLLNCDSFNDLERVLKVMPTPCQPKQAVLTPRGESMSLKQPEWWISNAPFAVSPRLCLKTLEQFIFNFHSFNDIYGVLFTALYSLGITVKENIEK